MILFIQYLETVFYQNTSDHWADGQTGFATGAEPARSDRVRLGHFLDVTKHLRFALYLFV